MQENEKMMIVNMKQTAETFESVSPEIYKFLMMAAGVMQAQSELIDTYRTQLASIDKKIGLAGQIQ